jgi:hypothetical protein
MECPFVLYNWLERKKQDFIGLRFWRLGVEQVDGQSEGDVMVWGMLLQWLVKRRHTHVGAPDNRIKGSF